MVKIKHIKIFFYTRSLLRLVFVLEATVTWYRQNIGHE